MPARTILFPILILCAGLVPASARAEVEEDGFTLSGSTRLRFEAIGGQARAGFDSKDNLVSLRTQILAQFRARPFEIVAEIYDSRVWGADPGTPVTTGEVNALEPVQAYVTADLGEVAGEGSKLRVQAGRFTLNLGSRRLIAADDYRNTTNGYTGIKADLGLPGRTKASFVYTLPQSRRPDDAGSLRDARVELDRESFEQVLWGGLVSRPLVAPAGGSRVLAELGYFHFGERDAPGRPTRDRSLDTASARIIAEPAAERFDFEVEGMYQWGAISASLAPAATRLPVSATFFHAEVGYTFAGVWKPRVALEFDRASGDEAGETYGRFDTLFGMRRGDLAPAGLYNVVGRANVVSPVVRVEAGAGRTDVFVSYRPLWLASRTDAFSTTAVRDAAGQSGDFAGHQIDARLRHWLLPKRLRFEIDGVLLAKGRFLKEAPNAPSGGTTRYVSINLTASF